MATTTKSEAESTSNLAKDRIVSGEAVRSEQSAFITGPDKHTQASIVDKTPASRIDETSDRDDLPEGAQYPSGVKFWLLMFNLGAVVVLSTIDMGIVATAVPRITDHFHTIADVGWYAIAFRLCQCAFQFLYGKAYKLFSVKRVFLLANIFSALGSLLSATAVSSTMLVVGRAVAGVGTAGLSAGAFMMLVQSTPLRKRPAFLGLWAAVEGTSTMAGPLLGGVITQTIGWRWCFYINLPIGGATLLLTFICFSETPKASNVARLALKEKLWQMDVVSNVILVPGLTCLFLAFSWGGTKYTWHSGAVIGLLITFGVLVTAFIYNQFRLGEAAALPLRILKRRSVIAGLVFNIFQNSAGNVFEYYLPIYYQAAHGDTPVRSGYLMLPYLVGGTLGAIGAGTGTSACGYYNPFMIFASVTMPIAAGLVTTFRTNTGIAKIIVYTGAFGLSYGIGSTGPATAIQTVLHEDDVPLGLSALLFTSALGPAVMVAIAQVIFTSQLSKNLHGLLPGVGRTTIEGNGLTELATKVPHTKLNEVLSGIDKSINHTWYLAIALACGTLLGSLPIEWRSVKKENRDHESQSRVQKLRITSQKEVQDG